MRTILLVDSARGDTTLLASALRLEGYDVLQVASSDEALATLERRRPLLAIVDLMLPGIHGLELAREMKQTQPLMHVLLTSNYHLSERQLEKADCGVSGFIPKPYDVQEVVAFVRGKLAGPPSTRRVAQPDNPVSGIVPRPDAVSEPREIAPTLLRRSK